MDTDSNYMALSAELFQCVTILLSWFDRYEVQLHLSVVETVPAHLKTANEAICEC